MSAFDWRDWTIGRRLAVAALVVALGWDVLALFRLVREDGAPASAPLAMGNPPTMARRPLDDPRLFMLAAARAPFDGATPPLPAVAFTPVPAAAVARPRLTGTVVQGSGGFVVIEQLDGTMRLLHVGERAAGLRLRSVSPGAAIFDDSTGTRVVLRAAPGETAARP